MSEIRVTKVIGENGSDPVGLSTGFTVGPTSGTTATITHEGQASFSGICTATAFAPTAGQLSHRNLIINGAMRVAQRASSSTANGYGTVDRFKVSYSGTDEYPTQAQVDVASGTTPYTSGFRKALKITNGNQTSGAGAADFITYAYRVEAQDMAGSGWNYTSTSSFITLSFYIKSSVAQSFGCFLRSHDGSQLTFPFETGSLSADTWTKIVKTIPGNASMSFSNDNGTGLEIIIGGFWGTDYTTSNKTLDAWSAYANDSRLKDNTSTWYTTNDATLELTGLQLEVGPVATPFEHRSYADELKRCRRYYFKTSRWMGGARGSSTSRNFTLDFGMRLTGSDVNSGTYTNDGTASGDVVYIGSNATRQVSNVTANSLSFSTSTNENQMSAGVIVGYGIGSGDNGIITGLYIGGFTIDHEL